jgi:cytochrome P450 PksS
MVSIAGAAPMMDIAIASAAFKANPHPFYARMRAEAPVCRVRQPTGQEAWLVARYDDVAALAKDERFAKDRRNAMTQEQLLRQPWVPGFMRALEHTMLDSDDPDHRRLRGLVHKAFTPRLIEQMMGRIQALADELLDAMAARGGGDLIAGYALPIPTTIIAQMIGVPEGDRLRFHRWSKSIMLASGSGLGVLMAIPGVIAFLRYIRAMIRARRADPRDDLLSALTQAEEAGDQLGEDELVAMVFLLLVAGHETTVNLIGNGALALLDHPEQRERLRAEPALIRPAIEELVRFESPVELMTERYARQDLEIAGAHIPRGALVFGAIASANRDESQFPDPDRLDLARSPNRHLAFGQGAHYCLGAPLARLEGQIAIATLLRRAPGLRLAVPREGVRWRRQMVLRGLEALPVAF